ncbi:MAG: hypothetical protein DLM60_02095 [Pseudonocardiales bacterium]|nr:MAG: hypothetical protein DLM60_02095 [Pseudonocardiales bacterium]
MSTTTTTGSAVGPRTEDDLDPIFLLAATDPEAMKAMNTELVAGFRATGGHLGGAFAGVPRDREKPGEAMRPASGDRWCR